MTVRKLKRVLEKVIMLLEIHETKSLERMLDDLILMSQSRVRAKPKAKEAAPVNLKQLIARIQRLKSPDAIVRELVNLDKQALLAFAKSVNVRVDKRESKSVIASVISGHLSLSNLNKKIGEREMFKS